MKFIHSRCHPCKPIECPSGCDLYSYEELRSALYEPVVNFIHNGPDAPYWLAASHEGEAPTPEEILWYLYREYHRQLNDPLFYPLAIHGR